MPGLRLILFALCCACLMPGGCRQVPPQTPRRHPAPTRPYGQTVKGALPWENSRAFLAARGRAGAGTRVAAFRTTLPDSLPGEESNVALAADRLAGRVVAPASNFSMNAALGPYSSERGFREGPVYVGDRLERTVGGGVCKIATTLYNCAILANLPVIERHAHGMLVPYVPPGQDATVDYAAADLKFRNESREPLLIWADTRGKTLYIAFYGREKPPRVAWGHRVRNRRPFPTIRRVNRKFRAGQTKVAVPGAEGLTVESWLVITPAGGRSVKKDLGIDIYRPLPRVIEYGPKRPS